MFRLRFGKFSLTLALRRRQMLWLGALVGAALFAAAIAKPHTFSDGDTLSASKLNENFDALYAKMNELDAWKTTEEAKGKSWRLIYETDVTSATTNLDVTGLNGDTDKSYRIIALIANGSGASATYSVAINNDTTAGNYGWQRVTGTAGAASANRNTLESGIAIGFATSATTSFSTTDILAKSGTSRHYIGHQLESVAGSTADSATAKHGVWTNTATNISSLNFKSTQTNGIGAGSHIEIWARR